MTIIRCQDSVFLTTDFDDCKKELRANQATFQHPLLARSPRIRPPAS
jgi:hypothetical protein